MKLYHYYRSSAAYRVRIALNYKGIEWETALVDLRPPVSAQHRPEFRAVNPQ
jgi:glutathione S-transferase